MHKNKYRSTSHRRPRLRRRAGNMLILIMVVIVFIVMPVAYFSLEFLRMLGAHQQQRSAIEAASMAVASDLSRIVVEDPYYGFISLSDQAPVGKGTTAGDNYYLPVHSINTLLATTRLDMIIADRLNSTLMRQIAALDYQRTMSAKNLLVQTLADAIVPGGFGKDMDGKTVSPLDDAKAAYESNLVRMTGGQSQLVPNSLKITLGCESGLYTVTKFPQPLSVASMQNDMRNETCYKAYVNVPYTTPDKKYDFIFAASDSEVRLLDYKLFQQNIAGLPYIIPCVVKCEGDQKFTTRDQYGKQEVRVVHAVACAEPSSVGDRQPNPGALSIDFSAGSLVNISSLQDIFANTQVMKCPTDLLYTPLDGDSPLSGLVEIAPPPLPDSHASFGIAATYALYDWIRRQGTGINVASLINAFKVPFDAWPTGAPHQELFQTDTSGNVLHWSDNKPARITKPVSHHQIFSRSGIALITPGPAATGPGVVLADIFVYDFVYQPGRIKGGLHAGEPLGPNPGASPMPPPAGIGRQIDETFQTIPFPTGPAGGAIRPTYSTVGIAVDILFILRKDRPTMP